MKTNAQKEPATSMRQTTIRLPEALLKRLQHLSIDLDKSFTALVVEALEEYAKAHGKKQSRDTRA